MLLYVIKRILWFIPTLFIVTLIGFVLLANAPGDPVNLLVSSNTSALRSGNDIEQQKSYWRKQLGLDLPLFYFSVTTLAEPDTLYKIYDEQKLKTYKELLHQCGNAGLVDDYFNAIGKSRKNYLIEMNRDFSVDTTTLFAKHKKQLDNIGISLNALERTSDTVVQKFYLDAIKHNLSGFKKKQPDVYYPIEESIQNLYRHTSKYRNYIPKIAWYGLHNQYHRWLFGGRNSKGIIRGDFGISYIKKEPVVAVIKDKLPWSLFFSVLSILLAYSISIPIGIRMAEKPEAALSKFSQYLFFILYSLPSFFVGVLLLMLFANPDLLSIFPPSGVKPIEGYDPDANLFQKFIDSIPYMVLPLICYTYSSLAFISRLTATGINEQLKFDYIKTARAKGLSEHKVIRKHALKNSLLPLITVFSSVFPGVIGGSVIIESIFSIPGMGLETARSIIAQDYPVVIAIITLSAVLTILSYLLADVLYAWVDPRIRK